MCDVHNLDCFKGVFSPLNQTDTVLSLRRKNQICWQIVFRYERVSDISLITLLVYYYTVGVSVQSQIVTVTSFFHHSGTQPSSTASPRSCPAGQFSCPPPGGCIEAAKRCDGIPHCLKGEDESGCHPHDNITQTQADRYSLGNYHLFSPVLSGSVVKLYTLPKYMNNKIYHLTFRLYI